MDARQMGGRMENQGVSDEARVVHSAVNGNQSQQPGMASPAIEQMPAASSLLQSSSAVQYSTDHHSDQFLISSISALQQTRQECSQTKDCAFQAERKLSELYGQLHEMESKYNSAIDTQKRLERIIGRLKNNESDARKMKKENEELKGKVQQMGEIDNFKKEKINDLEAKVRGMVEFLHELEAAREGAVQEAVQSAVQSESDRRAKAEEQHKNEVDALSQKLEATNLSMKVLQREHDSSITQITDLKIQADSAKDKMDTLAAEKQKLELALSNQKSEQERQQRDLSRKLQQESSSISKSVTSFHVRLASWISSWNKMTASNCDHHTFPSNPVARHIQNMESIVENTEDTMARQRAAADSSDLDGFLYDSKISRHLLQQHTELLQVVQILMDGILDGTNKETKGGEALKTQNELLRSELGVAHDHIQSLEQRLDAVERDQQSRVDTLKNQICHFEEQKTRFEENLDAQFHKLHMVLLELRTSKVGGNEEPASKSLTSLLDALQTQLQSLRMPNNEGQESNAEAQHELQSYIAAIKRRRDVPTQSRPLTRSPSPQRQSRRSRPGHTSRDGERVRIEPLEDPVESSAVPGAEGRQEVVGKVHTQLVSLRDKHDRLWRKYWRQSLRQHALQQIVLEQRAQLRGQSVGPSLTQSPEPSPIQKAPKPVQKFQRSLPSKANHQQDHQHDHHQQHHEYGDQRQRAFLKHQRHSRGRKKSKNPGLGVDVTVGSVMLNTMHGNTHAQNGVVRNEDWGNGTEEDELNAWALGQQAPMSVIERASQYWGDEGLLRPKSAAPSDRKPKAREQPASREAVQRAAQFQGQEGLARPGTAPPSRRREEPQQGISNSLCALGEDDEDLLLSKSDTEQDNTSNATSQSTPYVHVIPTQGQSSGSTHMGGSSMSSSLGPQHFPYMQNGEGQMSSEEMC